MAIPGTTFYLHLSLLKRTKLHVTCLFVGDDSESSDSGVDTLSTSTRGSFPSDYMDLDEFLSVQTQNCQENTQASCEDPQNLSLVASTSTRVAATTVSGLVEQVSPAVTEFSKVAASVNNVLSSVVLSKMSSLPLQVDPAVFQTLRANTSQPEGTNAIVQWCQSVGGTRQDHQEASGPQPGKTPVRRRRNSKYVYNPLPITKKAERKFYSQSQKDERYWERRIKNNVAAKRSRDLRRQKEIEVTEKYKNLEKENANLKEEVRRLRMKADELEKKLASFQGSH